MGKKTKSLSEWFKSKHHPCVRCGKKCPTGDEICRECDVELLEKEYKKVADWLTANMEEKVRDCSRCGVRIPYACKVWWCTDCLIEIVQNRRRTGRWGLQKHE